MERKIRLLARLPFLNNTTGAANTATGVSALVNNTTGGGNTATGVRALLNNTTGSLNTAIGIGALSTNNGDNNTAIGVNALLNTIGNFNTAIGQNALFNNTTGGANIALGVSAGSGIVTASNVIAIGAAGAERERQLFHRPYIRCNFFRRNRRFSLTGVVNLARSPLPGDLKN